MQYEESHHDCLHQWELLPNWELFPPAWIVRFGSFGVLSALSEEQACECRDVVRRIQDKIEELCFCRWDLAQLSIYFADGYASEILSSALKSSKLGRRCEGENDRFQNASFKRCQQCQRKERSISNSIHIHVVVSV